jgi:hypothetical protein
MPHAYSQKELTDTYAEIALERAHNCDECGTSNRLSHSHLVSKSRDGKLATTKTNIVYHCLSFGDIVGCHTKYESMDVARMKNFEKYFRIIHELDRQYFWMRIHKLEEHFISRDLTVWKRVRALMAEIDNIDHPYNYTTKSNGIS